MMPKKACPALDSGGNRFPAFLKPLVDSSLRLESFGGRSEVGKTSCSKKNLERDDDSKKGHPALRVRFHTRAGACTRVCTASAIFS